MTKQEIINEMEEEINSLNIRINHYGKDHSSTFRLQIKKQTISKYLALIKKLNEAIGSKEVFIDFMDWMRKYDFIDQVNMDELIVDEYFKPIK